jgi:NTP pyrophosphatase (non-canonical NTP hydrolase)
MKLKELFNLTKSFIKMYRTILKWNSFWDLYEKNLNSDNPKYKFVDKLDDRKSMMNEELLEFICELEQDNKELSEEEGGDLLGAIIGTYIWRGLNLSNSFDKLNKKLKERMKDGYLLWNKNTQEVKRTYEDKANRLLNSGWTLIEATKFRSLKQ